MAGTNDSSGDNVEDGQDEGPVPGSGVIEGQKRQQMPIVIL